MRTIEKFFIPSLLSAVLVSVSQNKQWRVKEAQGILMEMIKGQERFS